MRYEDLAKRLTVPPVHLYGAEGDDDPDTPDPQAGNDGTNPEPAKTYDQAYVDQLRGEAADRRVKAKEAVERAEAAEAELAKLKKAEMDDIERLQAELAEAQAAAEEALAVSSSANSALLTERIKNAVTLAAVDMGFNDPGDALSMISQDDIVDDEGQVDSRTVKARLKALTDKKPYLLKNPGPGSGDGGGRGNAPEPDTYESKVESYKQNMIAQGRVVRQ